MDCESSTSLITPGCLATESRTDHRTPSIGINGQSMEDVEQSVHIGRVVSASLISLGILITLSWLDSFARKLEILLFRSCYKCPIH